MTATDWQHVWGIFEEVISRPDSERLAFVESACAGDTALQRAVESMLEADREAGTLLDHPPPVQPANDGLSSQARSREAPAPRSAWTAPQSPKSPPLDHEATAADEGSRIGAYQIEKKIGEGGMGAVYLARRSADGQRRRVVVKIVRRGMEHADVLERLRSERIILAGLEHPNIARLYDGGTTEEGLPFFVMEYVDGLPIDQFCTEHGLSIKQRVELFRKVCAAVHYAHQNLVVHRDLKPSNILVTRDGEPKLLDFGIAKVLDAEAWNLDIEPTRTVNRLLTPSYASPEQFRGTALSTASDVYSLGVLLYRLLTGCLPFDFSGLSPAQIERLVATTEPTRPSTAVRSQASRLAKSLEGDLDAIVLKALRSDPGKRYGTAEQLGLELQRHLDGRPVEARRGTFRYRASLFVRRHRAALAALTLIASLLVSGGVALAVQATRLAQERDHARLERDQKSAVIGLFEDLVTSAEPLARPDSPSDLTVSQWLTASDWLLVDRLEDQPLVHAQLLHTSGAMLSRLGHLDEARGHLEEALALRRSVLGDSAPDVAATQCQLAKAHQESGHLESAEGLARECVAGLRAVADQEKPLLVDALSILSQVLWARQNFDGAEARAREAQALVEESGQLIDDFDPSSRLRLLAAIENRHGRYDRAAALLREALAANEKHYGEKAPQREGLLNDLALALRWLGDLEGSEQAYEEAQELLLATYGRNHPHYARLLNNLGGVRFAKADYEGAVATYEEAKTILLAAAPNNWRVFLIESNIQAARIRQGHAAEATRALTEGRAAWEPKLGERQWLLAQVDSLLGEAAAAEGRLVEAERLLTESFRRLIAVESKDRYQQKALDRLSTFLTAQGRAEEIAAWEAMLPSNNPPS